MVDAKRTPYKALLTFFIGHIVLSTFLIILELFEHIKAPLSGLIGGPRNVGPGITGGAFSIRHLSLGSPEWQPSVLTATLCRPHPHIYT